MIVDMGEQVEALVERLVTFGPEDADTALDALLRAGEAALPVLVRHFPGPLWFHRAMPHRKLPRGRDVSAIARALVAFDAEAVPYLASLVGDPRDDVRFYALLVSSEHVDTRLLPAIVPRLFDADDGVRALALRVLTLYRRFPEALGRALHPVRAEARVPRKDTPPERRLQAIAALGELRDRRSLDPLVELLEDGATRAAAHAALVTLTRQDFGQSARRWLAWTERQEGRHRIEWLIDSLLHADEALRAAAAEELQQLTQQYLGYHANLPKREREVAQEKYRAWWERDGRRAWNG